MSKNIWSKKLVIEKLKEIAKHTTDLSPSDIKNKYYPLYKASVNHFGSLKVALQASDIIYSTKAQQNNFWSSENIALLKKYLKSNLTNKEIAQNFGITTSKIIAQKKKLNLKSKNDLLRLKSRPWTKAEIEIIKSTTNKKSSEIAKLLNRSIPAINQKRKDLKLNSTRDLKWNKKLVIEAISKRHQESQSLKAGFVHTNHKALYRAACRLFNQWSKAVEASGINYIEEIRSFDYWDSKKIIDLIIKLQKENNDLSSAAIQKSHRALYQAACLHIGNWEKAMDRAGLDYKTYLKISQPKPISKKEIIAQIKEWHSKGEPINIGNINQKFPNFEAQARRKFGTWEKVIEASGIKYEEIKLIITTEMDNGLKLEDILETYFKKFKPHYVRQPRLVKNGKKCLIPDFYDPENNHWIDCKLSCWSIGTKETIQKYSLHAKEVHIYYLFGKNPKNLKEVLFFSIENLIQDSGDQNLIRAIEKIKHSR